MSQSKIIPWTSGKSRVLACFWWFRMLYRLMASNPRQHWQFSRSLIFSSKAIEHDHKPTQHAEPYHHDGRISLNFLTTNCLKETPFTVNLSKFSARRCVILSFLYGWLKSWHISTYISPCSSKISVNQIASPPGLVSEPIGYSLIMARM